MLHAVVLEHILGLSPKAQVTALDVRYVRDPDEAWHAPERDPTAQAAFLLNPTPVRQVLRVCDAGEVMPAKSTDFQPSVPGGLVMSPVETDAPSAATPRG